MSAYETPRLASITLDCGDPASLAQFWSDLLGAPLTHSNQRVAMVMTPARLLLTCVLVPDYSYPTWPDNRTPKQIHLDLAVADLDLAQLRAVELGAALFDHQPAPQQRRILSDPAGHPFCLCLPRADLTTEGN